MSDTQASEHVQIVVDGSIARIILNRPECKNALTQAMYLTLAKALSDVSNNPKMMCVVLQGSQDTFTAGNDLGDFMTGIDTSDPKNPIAQFMWALLDCKVPVIAAVSGHAVGIGTTLLQYCDMVFARHDAKLQMPFVRLGLCPEFGASYLLANIVGHAVARDWLLTGRRISAQEAYEAKLITAVVSDPIKVALQRAQELALLPPKALRASKAMLIAGEREPIKKAILHEIDIFAEALKGAEFREAATAFFEKRQPNFTALSED